MKKTLIIVIALIFHFNISYADEASVRSFINDVANQVIKIASNESASKRQKASGIMNILEANFDVPWMSKFVLGAAYRDLTSDQQQVYTDQYQKYLLYSYLPNLLKYSNETFKIIDIKQTGQYDYTANTQVIRTDGKPPIQISYHIKISKNNPNLYKAIDIVVEGVSALLSERSEFQEIVQQSGVSQLITLIENKNKQFDQEYS
jgi:phospholipid transport system substrate-binding protein